MKINLWGSRDRESIEALRKAVNAHEWYHVIDFGHGVITPGQYDLRPILDKYGIPRSLRGKSIMDVGPAHGFFAFEFERRGASRVCTAELPSWTEHDADDALRARHVANKDNAAHFDYHAGTLGFAIAAMESKVHRLFYSVYDIGPETTGVFDIVFCASVLLHLTDPLRAMYGIRRATREMAIITTGIDTAPTEGPVARFFGTPSGLAFWFPNMECLEKMALAAGFRKVERVSTFELKSVDGKFCTPHGTIRAYP